jgi:hypothetical protein
MWTRGIVGVLFCLVGGVWIGQGAGVIHGSFMTGQGLYVVLGAALVLGGVWLLRAAVRIRAQREA